MPVDVVGHHVVDGVGRQGHDGGSRREVVVHREPTRGIEDLEHRAPRLDEGEPSLAKVTLSLAKTARPKPTEYGLQRNVGAWTGRRFRGCRPARRRRGHRVNDGRPACSSARGPATQPPASARSCEVPPSFAPTSRSPATWASSSGRSKATSGGCSPVRRLGPHRARRPDDQGGVGGPRWLISRRPGSRRLSAGTPSSARSCGAGPRLCRELLAVDGCCFGGVSLDAVASR